MDHKLYDRLWNFIFANFNHIKREVFLFFYLDFLFYTVMTTYILSVRGELGLYALYMIDLLVENIGLVVENVIVLRNFSNLDLLAGNVIHL